WVSKMFMILKGGKRPGKKLAIPWKRINSLKPGNSKKQHYG
ncbi:MAG: hypothetical protein ACP5E3_19565, partial [Bacteroidales bacterium]